MLTLRLQTFFALLALITLVGAGLLGATLVMRRQSGPAQVLAQLEPYRFRLAAAVAITCMAGSLYFSEVANYLPCTMCWYQRIAMYSLAVVTTLAAVRRDLPRAYVLVLAALGMVLSGYHWLLERIPELDVGACSVTISCEAIWFQKFGFVTLAFMAFSGFSAIATLMLIPDPSPTETTSPTENGALS